MSSKAVSIFTVILLAMASVAHAAEPILKTGDIVGITVTDEADLTRAYSVDNAGFIKLPGEYGKVSVAGKTPSQAEEEVLTTLRKLIKAPSVSLQLVKQAGIKVIVNGAVKSPGTIESQQEIGIRDVLAFVGGELQTSDLSQVQIIRAGTKIPVDLEALRADPDPSKDVKLQDGDSVYVPSSLLGKFTVLGAVKNVGTYPLIRGMKVLDAVKSAGGPLDTSKVVKLKLTAADGVTTHVVDLNKLLYEGDTAQNRVIMPGDTVFVESDSSQPGQFTVMGGVLRGGPMPLTQKTNVLQAVGMAGGFTQNAKPDKATLVRKQSDGSTKSIPLDLKKLIADGAAEEMFVQDGDVLNIPDRGPKGPGLLPQIAPYLWVFF